MQAGQMLIEEPVRLVSVLTPCHPFFFSSLTKVIGTLGPKSRSTEVIEKCLHAGMSVARFDFSWLDAEYHQETLDNLRLAGKNVKKLCAVMLDTMGPALQVLNKNGNPIQLEEDDHITITPDLSQEPSSKALPVNFDRLAEIVRKGDTIFIGQYLSTGIESTSVWLEVLDTKDSDVTCLVKNTATLSGVIFTVHVCQVNIGMPTLTEFDKEVISTWGTQNKVDFVSLSYTRHVEDVRELRAFLNAHNLSETQIFAKIETLQGLKYFDEILQEADGIILSRGTLGIDLPPEKVFSFQKSALRKCNMAGKSVIITRVLDSMTDNLRPTRAEATDIANAVLDGCDGIILGPEILRGQYPVEAIKTVGRICSEAENVFNQALHYKKLVKHLGDSLTHVESVASSAVRAAIIVRAVAIIVFTSSGRAARLVAKYRPTMPVLAVVIPRIKADNLGWSLSGSTQARQCLAVRGIYPMLADSRLAGSGSSRDESGLTLALNHGKAVGLINTNDRVVLFQKIGDSSVVKIIECP